MRDEWWLDTKVIYVLAFGVRTIPNLERYYSSMPNFLSFRTYDVKSFLVFIVQNVKYLAFETPDTSALFFFFFFYKIEILF